MKILLPIKVETYLDLDSDPITGGIVKFCKQIYDNIDGVIPVQVTKEDRAKRRARSIMEKAVYTHNPDVVIGNEIDYTYNGLFQEHDVPLISVIHEPLNRDIRMVAMGPRVAKATEDGAHTYFVSGNQQSYLRELFIRISGDDIGAPTGYVNSSFCDVTAPFFTGIEYDALTVGRTEALKDPFWLHRKCGKTDEIQTLVVTSTDQSYDNDNQNNYVSKNQSWSRPRNVLKDLPHSQILTTMASSGIYVSTCPSESWGITALEALTAGLPLILTTTGSLDAHSTEDVAASSNHYRKIPRSVKVTEFVEVVKDMNKMSIEERREISEMTKEKHSKENWVKSIEDMIDRRLADPQKSQRSYQALPV